MDKFDKIFRDYGIAMHHAQFLEYDIATMILADSIPDGKGKTIFALTEYVWGEKTLGQLIKYIKKTPNLPIDIKSYFENVRNKRNYLAHQFFIKHAENMDSDEGIDIALNEIAEITKVIKECGDFIKAITQRLALGPLRNHKEK